MASLALVLLLASSSVVVAQEASDTAFTEAEDVELELEGPIIQIAPDEEQSAKRPAVDERSPAGAREGSAMPKYWLGLQGRTVRSEVLRTHLQLAADLGVVIEKVVPGSPAEQAGLRQHDVVIAVGGEPLQDMLGLRKQVMASNGKPIELKVIRLAKEIKLTVTPQAPPAGMDFAPAQRDSLGRDPFGGDRGAFADQLRRFGDLRGGLGGFGMQSRVMALPGGVSISIQQRNGAPADITVKRGDEQWNVRGDDPKSLEQLPEDLRVVVKQMLRQPAPGGLGNGGAPGFGNQPRAFDFEGDLRRELDQILPGELGQQPAGGRSPAEERMLQRMRELEKRMEQMQRDFDAQENQ